MTQDRTIEAERLAREKRRSIGWAAARCAGTGLFLRCAPPELGLRPEVLPTPQQTADLADVYQPERWLDDALFAPEVRAAYFRLLDQGWTDSLRTIQSRRDDLTGRGKRLFT